MLFWLQLLSDYGIKEGRSKISQGLTQPSYLHLYAMMCFSISNRIKGMKENIILKIYYPLPEWTEKRTNKQKSKKAKNKKTSKQKNSRVNCAHNKQSKMWPGDHQKANMSLLPYTTAGIKSTINRSGKKYFFF